MGYPARCGEGEADNRPDSESPTNISSAWVSLHRFVYLSGSCSLFWFPLVSSTAAATDMTGDSCPKPSEETAAAAAAARQRKKRKWDQPAESLISVGLVVPGALPSGVGAPTGLGVPGIVPLSSPVLVNSVAAACATAPQLYQAPVLQQTAAAIIQKISQVRGLVVQPVLSRAWALKIAGHLNAAQLVLALQEVGLGSGFFCPNLAKLRIPKMGKKGHRELLTPILVWLPSSPGFYPIETVKSGKEGGQVGSQALAADVWSHWFSFQPKIQDELIAREIVINDADAAIRCKLTKRQTQEEIQKCTGAVVITRGRYQPPNALPDNDKPLFLHISSGANLKDTAERIKAVDHAASIVEEILKHGQSSQLVSSLSLFNSGGQVIQPLTKCLYLGFDPDPTLNIAARIRGPNDQYINHIMNETGVTVILRGRGSGNAELPHAGDAQASLHLYLSGSNSKSLEDARILAENLLDTICLECGVSRLKDLLSSLGWEGTARPRHMWVEMGPDSIYYDIITVFCISVSFYGDIHMLILVRMSACKAYKAVPPPLKLLDGVESSDSVSISPIDSAAAKLSFSTAAPVSLGSNISPPGSLLPSISGGTSYSGYGGIYPQATPLQQVALALRRAPASTSSVPATSVFPATSTCTVPKVTSAAGAEKDKRPQRRKFQELPVALNCPTASYQNSRQGSESLKPGVSLDDLPVKSASSMSPPKLVQLHCEGMPPPCPMSAPPPPPQKIMPPPSPPPPPPPKFTAPKLPPKDERENGAPKEPSMEPVPDTLMKLMEYGDEDEDADVNSEEYSKCDSTLKTTAKPFWAV
ncbi:hypothetical protein Taro_005262 [Colocasia esculenta]|uniref:Protein RIK n=1 Tax=Colocasia esculenta TaxID=4460 RepID=A0A843TMI2_COLES|nr:hypothetical protein [Colocasia esculenta]